MHPKLYWHISRHYIRSPLPWTRGCQQCLRRRPDAHPEVSHPGLPLGPPESGSLVFRGRVWEGEGGSMPGPTAFKWWVETLSRFGLLFGEAIKNIIRIFHWKVIERLMNMEYNPPVVLVIQQNWYKEREERGWLLMWLKRKPTLAEKVWETFVLTTPKTFTKVYFVTRQLNTD